MLTLQVFTSILSGQSYLFNWQDQISSWSHEIRAFGGYWEASASQAATLEQAEEWLENGLGRHVEIYDDTLSLVWEGFVDSVGIEVAGLQMSRGPLVDIANKVKLIYSTIDTTDGGFGARAETSYAENTTSQGLYGELVKILSSGGVAQGEAEQLRDTFLAENAYPITTTRLALGGASDSVRVSISLKGYCRLFETYPFASATTGQQNLSARLSAIIDDDPNSYFSSSNADITTNTVQVGAWENDDPTAWDSLKSLVAMGDASENRYLFGVYGGRKIVYEAAPTTVEYVREIRSGGDLRTPQGLIVPPWRVSPGKWVRFTDLLIGRSSTAFRQDPRLMFIERVVYSMPRGLQLDGSRLSTVDQRLARLGLSGLAS